MSGIKITATRGSTLGSLPNIVTPVKIAFVGQSNGADLYKRNIEMNSANWNDASTYARTQDIIKDTTTETEVRAISKVALDIDDDVNVFRQGYDYVLTAPNLIEWQDKAIGSAWLTASTGTGGTYGDGTYNFRVYARGMDGTNYGATSNTVTVITDSSTANSVTLQWDKVEFATGYAISSSSDGTNYHFVEIITSGSTLETTLLTDATVTTPSFGSALRKPDGTYYVDYKTVEYNYSVDSFTSLREVLLNHGLGSDLTNMARIAFNNYGIDEIYLCATDGTNASAYTDAIDKVSNLENIQYVVALTDIDNVHNYNVNQARINSRDDVMKERYAIVSKVNTVTTQATLITWVESFNSEKRAICVVPNGNKIYMDSWQEANGDMTDNKAVSNSFLAGALGCAIVSAPNVATSVINTTVNGFNFGAVAPSWVDNVEKNKFLNAGATYVMVKKGRPVFYNDNTNDISMTENFERSVASAEDEIRRRLRESGERYIGKPIIDSLLASIYSSTSDVLGGATRDSIIRGFRNIEVTQDTITPTRVNVTFIYSPIYPLLEIVFNYGFDL